MDLNIRIAGEAGQGLVSVGEMLSRSFAKCGLHIFAGLSYMSRIRGGLNWYDIRISNSELFGLREKPDMLVAMSNDALKYLKDEVTENGTIILNAEESSDVIACDFVKLAKEIGGSRIMANSVAAGAVLACLEYDVEVINDLLKDEFRDKSNEIIEKNIACVKAGYDTIVDRNCSVEAPRPSGEPCGELAKGATAIALSAAVSGVKFISAYPMSPSTATFTAMAKLSDQYGIVVEQAEDEIAAINMICGAAYAGVNAMTTTSGGGFALMGEGISLAGIMELPIMIVLAQRPGPATGLPTRTAQEDLNLALFSGHGEFARAIFSPGTHQQCYGLTRHALQLANKFQTPMILLTDQYLQDSVKNIAPLHSGESPVDRCLVENADESYQRYELTESGVSPRAIPGGNALVICDSDEHDSQGHLNEDFQIRVQQQDKRMRKLDGLKNAIIPPEHFGDHDPELLFICWGSTYGAIREAVELLNAKGQSSAMLHFSQIWPINIDQVNQFLERESVQRAIVVEGNFTGQFATLLMSQGCRKNLENINRYDGLPFTVDDIIRKVES